MLAGSVAGAVRPFARTGRYYAQSWQAYRDDTADELPIVRPTAALAAQAFRDEVVLAGLKVRRPVSQPREFARINDEVVAALDFYDSKGWLDKPKGFFGTPPPLSDVTLRQVTGRKRTYQQLSFDSGYRPHPGEPGGATVAGIHRGQTGTRRIAAASRTPPLGDLRARN